MGLLKRERRASMMHDSAENRILAVVVICVADVEHIGLLWWACYGLMQEWTRPYPDDMQIGYGFAFVLCLMVALAGVCAAIFFAGARRWVPDGWERVAWAGGALALSPWATLVFCLLALPLVPLTAGVSLAVGYFAGIVTPYIVLAHWLRRR
jgi:hypothetical protein